MAIETKCVHLLLLLLVSLYVRIGSAQYGDSCTMSDGRRGSCIPLPQCKYATDLIRQNGINSITARQFLQNNSCGFEGNNQKVCCPQDQSSTGERNPSFPNQGGNSGGNNQGWTYPDQGGNAGSNNQGNEGQNSGSNNPGNGGQQTNPNVGSVLPDNCGISESNRIIGGTATDLGEFPWMAIIEYLEYRQTLRTGCGGAVISKRYVLTAAHCIRDIPPTWQVRSVRLGEHDMATNPDCVDDGYGRRNCAVPTISVPYQSVIVHEKYNNPAQFRNDIALIRLAYDVQTSAYIQPICLPLSGLVSQSYWSAGWGQTNTRRSSEVKLKVSLNYADFGRCATRYSTKRVTLGEGQMCAGGTAGKDSCRGDSGGPLMKMARQNGRDRWYVDGVVSIGHSPCGLEGWPGVYTKIYNYVPWIVSQLKP